MMDDGVMRVCYMGYSWCMDDTWLVDDEVMMHGWCMDDG